MAALVMMNRKKKSILYLLCSGALIYYVIQVVYFNQEYSPLQVLADARSEARRLLRFITLYHYQCNNTVMMSNNTNWPICTEVDGGINLESKNSKKAYSVGPSEDLEFERLLVRNLSFNVFLMCHRPIYNDGSLNNTYVIKTVVVPNNPSDFTRNSYETQTLNDIMLNLHHTHIDILKIENVMDEINTHEILFYLVNDDLLKKVDQLHISLHIDKVDDDHLYSWYRSLYNLFHKSRFRLYHTSASDQLCLQVTLMESCTYYMSWVRDPGPQTMILYPPAIDGSMEFELSRIEDYLEKPEGYCDDSVDIPVLRGTPISLCTNTDRYMLRNPCKIILIGEEKMQLTTDSYLPFDLRCDVIGLKMLDGHIDADVNEYTTNNKGTLQQSTHGRSTVLEALDKYTLYDNKNILYLNMPDMFWEIITPLLNSGVLKGFHQLIIDINLHRISKNLPVGTIRTYFSELKRIESYGFDLFQSIKLGNGVKFGKNSEHHRLNYVKTRPPFGKST
ncbi:unnamed protein product [Mytilus edulis]|uniref:Uncharacterized protein n=1 Tax=Mytilus edulis TaxID=6550 RepID=A0A8S3TG14_MYTED|nr:unnamed protein product [Mytilus edulis]CAG2228102.1 unnamed protein product [Mytilus edulis]